AQLRGPRAFARGARQREERFLGYGLDAGREIRVPLVRGRQRSVVGRLVAEIRREPGRLGEEQRLHGARLAEQLHERVAVSARRRVLKVEVLEIQRERAVALHVDQLAHLLDEAWTAVRRHPHYLVFPLVHLEPEERGERRVEQSERVREMDLVRERDGAVAPAAGRR